MELIRPTTSPLLFGLVAHHPSGLSRAMHTAGFAALGLPCVYLNFATDNTKGAIEAMRTLGIGGLSLTIPHKERAMLLVDEFTAEAKEIGAINTVVNREGRICGENSDWNGVIEAFREAGSDQSGKDLLILGAGGAARAAIFAAKKLGARSISVWGRTVERVDGVCREFGVERATTEWERYDTVINATPVGGTLSDEKHPFELSLIQKHQTVFDMVTAETPLLLRAREGGGTAISGVRMLLFQALRQFELFTGHTAPRQAMERALNEVYGS